MANRFGRNQRRRMREQVSALESNLSNMQQAYAMADGLQKYTSQQLEDARYQLNVCEEVLGKHFVAFDPKTMHVDHFLETVRIPLPDFTIVDLKPVELSVRKSANDIGYHIKLETPNGISCLYMSEQAIASMSLNTAQDYLLKAVGRDLVRHAVNMSHGRTL